MITRLTLYIVFSCALHAMLLKDSRAELNAGVIVGKEYKNDALAVTFCAPKGWNISIGNGVVTSKEDPNADEPITTDRRKRAADCGRLHFIRRAELFSIRKEGEPDRSGQSLSAGADELSGNVRITAGEYLTDAKEDFRASPLPFVIERDVYQVPIGGVAYAAMTIKMEFENVGILRQQILATTDNGYIVFFNLAYRTDDELRELQQIVATITFGNK
ncbi:MAG TPA: hypothetical protein VHV55_10550 [Pirellulales bacterium]|nr:hypothetical protein [Pirellulales bacterium]